MGKSRPKYSAEAHRLMATQLFRSLACACKKASLLLEHKIQNCEIAEALSVSCRAAKRYSKASRCVCTRGRRTRLTQEESQELLAIVLEAADKHTPMNVSQLIDEVVVSVEHYEACLSVFLRL